MPIPVLCPGHGTLIRIPLDQPPSLHLLRGCFARSFVRRLRRYYAAVRLPVIVHRRRASSDFPTRSPEVRKVIYTTNAIESLNMTLRKVTKNRASFPNDEAALKLLYMALVNISKKWTRPIYDWKAALNQFAIVYEGRLPEIDL
jgi:mutator family transposase